MNRSGAYRSKINITGMATAKTALRCACLWCVLAQPPCSGPLPRPVPVHCVRRAGAGSRRRGGCLSRIRARRGFRPAGRARSRCRDLRRRRRRARRSTRRRPSRARCGRPRRRRSGHGVRCRAGDAAWQVRARSGRPRRGTGRRALARGRDRRMLRFPVRPSPGDVRNRAGADWSGRSGVFGRIPDGGPATVS